MDKGIAEFIRLFENESHEIFREATRRVSNSLVRLSPVDEGEFVANWELAKNRNPDDPERADDPKKRLTRKRLRDLISSGQYGDTFIFTNRDPVGPRLEFGYSSQAPQGITRLTSRRWRRFVRGAARAAQARVGKKVFNQ